VAVSAVDSTCLCDGDLHASPQRTAAGMPDMSDVPELSDTDTSDADTAAEYS
jgi:hypothetical protein